MGVLQPRRSPRCAVCLDTGKVEVLVFPTEHPHNSGLVASLERGLGAGMAVAFVARRGARARTVEMACTSCPPAPRRRRDWER